MLIICIISSTDAFSEEIVFEDEELGFMISFPSHWKITNTQSNEGGNVRAENSGGEAFIDITVFYGADADFRTLTSSQLDEVSDMMLEKYSEGIENTTLIKDYLNGKLFYSFRTESDLLFYIYFGVYNDKAYSIIAFCEEGLENLYRNDIETSIKTFLILDEKKIFGETFVNFLFFSIILFFSVGLKLLTRRFRITKEARKVIEPESHFKD